MSATGFEALALRVSESKTTTFTADLNTGVYLCDGTFTATLPPAADAFKAGKFGASLTFKHTGTSGTVTIDGDGAETIDGSATRALSAKDSITVTSDGTGWHIAPMTNASATAAEVSVADAGGLWAGSTVEAVLQELEDGKHVANVATDNVIGGIPVLHVVTVADAATGDVDVTLTHKTVVTDVWLVKTGGAGGASDTITVKNGSTAITDAIDINISDAVIARAGTIDDAQQAIAAAGTLKVTRTKASAANVACIVYVSGYRSA